MPSFPVAAPRRDPYTLIVTLTLRALSRHPALRRLQLALLASVSLLGAAMCATGPTAYLGEASSTELVRTVPRSPVGALRVAPQRAARTIPRRRLTARPRRRPLPGVARAPRRLVTHCPVVAAPVSVRGPPAA